MKSIKDIKAIIAAQVISSLGDQLTLLASFAAILSRTGNPIEAASPLLVKGIVQMIFGVLSLQFIDRVSSKRLIIAADFMRFSLIGFVAVAPSADTPLILLVQALCTIIEIMFNSAREKLFNSHLDSLEPSQQQQFAALDNQLITFLEVAGLAVGFALIGGVNYRIAFGVDAITFLISAAVVSKVVDCTTFSDGESIFGIAEIKGGFNAVIRHSALSRSMVVRSLFWIGAGIFNMVELKLVAEYFHNWNPSSTVALSKAILSLGFVVGLEQIKRHAERATSAASNQNEIPRLFSYCGIGNLSAALCTVAIIATRSVWLLGSIFFIYGLGTGWNSFGMRRIRQLATQEDKATRGRVVTITNMAANVCNITGMAFVSIAARPGLSSTISLLIVSAVCMATSALVAFVQVGSARRVGVAAIK